MLTLTPGAGADIRDPSPAQISGALRALRGRDDDFAVLSRDGDASFIQAAGGGEHGLGLEVRAGPEADLVRCLATLGLDDLERAFAAFAAGDLAWMADYAWEPVV